MHTFGSLLEAQPAQGAAVAADAGGAGGAGVQGDGPDHQGQGERQVQAAWDVHVHLRKRSEDPAGVRWVGCGRGVRFISRPLCFCLT